MSQLSLQEIKLLWDEFCVEINAEDFYEHLPTFVEIPQEGKWRTDALDVRKWLRGNLAKRVRRLCGPEDYGPSVASADDHGRPVISETRRPSWPKFDKRNGALVAVGTQPFTELEVQDGDGESMTSEEAVDCQVGQTAQDEDGHINRVMLANSESLRILGHRTRAEHCEAYRREDMAVALKNDRAAFYKALTDAITAQRELVKRMELDQDEAVVLAVIQLLWSVGPRMYLNFLDGPTRSAFAKPGIAWTVPLLAIIQYRRTASRTQTVVVSDQLRAILTQVLDFRVPTFLLLRYSLSSHSNNELCTAPLRTNQSRTERRNFIQNRIKDL
jgi:hypothetical protein